MLRASNREKEDSSVRVCVSLLDYRMQSRVSHEASAADERQQENPIFILVLYSHGRNGKEEEEGEKREEGKNDTRNEWRRSFEQQALEQLVLSTMQPFSGCSRS